MKVIHTAVASTAINLAVVLHQDSLRSVYDSVKMNGLPYLFTRNRTTEPVPTPMLPTVEEAPPLVPAPTFETMEVDTAPPAVVETTQAPNEETAEEPKPAATTETKSAATTENLWKNIRAQVKMEVFHHHVEPMVKGLQEWVPWINWEPLLNATSNEPPVIKTQKEIVADHLERIALRTNKTVHAAAAARLRNNSRPVSDDEASSATSTATTWSSSPRSLWNSLNYAFGNFTASVTTQTAKPSSPSGSSSNSTTSACQSFSDSIANTVHSAIDHGVKPFAFWTINASVSSVNTLLRRTPLINTVHNNSTLSDACPENDDTTTVSSTESLLKARVESCLDKIKATATSLAAKSTYVCESTQAAFWEIGNLANATVHSTGNALEQSATFAMTSATTAKNALHQSASSAVTATVDAWTFFSDSASATRQWIAAQASKPKVVEKPQWVSKEPKGECTGKRFPHITEIEALRRWRHAPRSDPLFQDIQDFGFVCDEGDDLFYTLMTIDLDNYCWHMEKIWHEEKVLRGLNACIEMFGPDEAGCKAILPPSKALVVYEPPSWEPFLVELIENGAFWFVVLGHVFLVFSFYAIVWYYAMYFWELVDYLEQLYKDNKEDLFKFFEDKVKYLRNLYEDLCNLIEYLRNLERDLHRRSKRIEKYLFKLINDEVEKISHKIWSIVDPKEYQKYLEAMELEENRKKCLEFQLRQPVIILELNQGPESTKIFREKAGVSAPHENRPTFEQNGNVIHERMGYMADGRRYYATEIDVEFARGRVRIGDCPLDLVPLLFQYETKGELRSQALMLNYENAKSDCFGNSLASGAVNACYIYIWEDRTLLAVEAKPHEDIIEFPTVDISDPTFEEDA